MTAQVTVSVVRDGATAWLCRVDWPDGRTRWRGVGNFHLSGLPDVVITSEAEALGCLERWVQQRPQDWQPE